jgi:hypothetical protein
MKRQRLLAIGLLIAAVGVIIPVAALGQTSETGSFNGLKDGGYLRLHFPDAAAAATFKQYQADGVTEMAGQSQNVTVANSCTVSFGTPQLAAVTSSATVGAETSGNKFVGLGVKGRSSTGTNCGRVEPGETISLALGSGLKTTDGGDGSSLFVTAAELDVDSKGQALIRADLFNGGSSPVGFALLSTTSSGGDSGPDATSGDNFAFPLNSAMPPCAVSAGQPVAPSAGQICGTFAPFRKITLSTTTRPSGTPSFALEGGRSGDARSAYAWDTFDLRTNTADTVFKLQASDGVLNCGDEKTVNATDSFKRGTNNKDGSPCVVVGYDYNQTVDTDTNTKSVELLWDTASQPGAAFSLTQTWLPEDSTTLGDGRSIPSKSTQVKWDETIGFIVAPACTSTKLPSAYGTLASDPGIGTTVTIALATGVTARTDAFNVQVGNEVISVPAQNVTPSGGVVTYSGVMRGAGNTTIGSSYAIGTKVMTTPFPILGTGASAYVAQMCVATSGWTSTGVTGTSGFPQVQVTETLLAEGDMIGKH